MATHVKYDFILIIQSKYFSILIIQSKYFSLCVLTLDSVLVGISKVDD